MADYTTLETHIQTRLARTDLDDAISQATLLSLNHYQDDLFDFNFGRWSATITSLTHFSPISLYPDLLIPKQVIFIYSGGRYEVCPKNYYEIDSMHHESPDITGLPYYYAIRNGEFYWYPAPDTNYRTEVTGIKELDRDAWCSNAFNLIIERTYAYIRLHYLHDDMTERMAHTLGIRSDGAFLSNQEEAAYRVLKRRTGTQSSLRITPYYG